MNVPNNRKINSLAVRLIKSSKARSFASVFAVIMTTILVVTVITMGCGIIDASRVTQMRSIGQNADVSFQYLTENEVSSISSNSLVKEYGISKYIASVKEKPWNQETLEIRTADEKFANMTYSMPIIGRLPQDDDEVAVKSWMLDKLDIPKELGQTFPLTFTVDKKQYDMNLKICGIWDDNQNLLPFGTAYISDSLAEELLLNVDVKKSIEKGNYSGSIQMYANLNGSPDKIQSNLDKIVLKSGINPDISIPRVNSIYSDSNMDKKSFFAFAMILVIIIISGYLLIYNIFYISIVKDIKIYGMLKIIGTTRPQIKRIVNIQALIYSVIGIPIGLLIGYILSIVLFPLFVSTTSIDNDISIRPKLLSMVAAVLLSFITVFVSCRYPSKIASRISPIEAIKYNGISIRKYKKAAKDSKKTSIHRMALLNLFRNKKKTFIIIASISIGLILMDIFFTLSKSFNVNEMAKSYIYGDFLISDESYLNMTTSYEPAYTLSEEIASKIESLNSIKDIAKIYYKYDTETYINGFTNTHSQLYGMDSYWLDTLDENMIEGNFDKSKFLSGNYILIGSDEENKLHIGDKVTLGINGGKQYEVMGKVDYSNLYALSARFFLGVGFSAYIVDSELYGNPQTDLMSVTVFSKNGQLEKSEREIQDLIETYQNIDYRSRRSYVNEIKNNNSQFIFVGTSLSLIILLIGILNFTNTLSANILSRKYEFAILHAIGMTTKQIRTILIMEGLYFIVIICTILLTFGTLISFGIIQLFNSAHAFIYQFSITPIFISLLVLFVVAIIIPQYFYRAISKSTIVERINNIN